MIKRYEMEKILEVKNLSVSFDSPKGEVQAVRDVSFSLKKGEVLAIVGESGCGNGFSQSTSSTPQKISTSIASWPFWRSAPQIPVPETMEISLSVLVPPAKTTIFMILHLLVCAVRNFVMIDPIYLRTSIYSYTTTGMPTSILA